MRDNDEVVIDRAPFRFEAGEKEPVQANKILDPFRNPLPADNEPAEYRGVVFLLKETLKILLVFEILDREVIFPEFLFHKILDTLACCDDLAFQLLVE